MTDLILAIVGTLVTMLTWAGFTVFQLEKTSAEAHGPEPTPEPVPEPAADPAPAPEPG